MGDSSRTSRLNLHEDAQLNQLLAGEGDDHLPSLHPLGGLPARISLTVLLDFALVVDDVDADVADGSVVELDVAAGLVATGQSLWLTIEGHEVSVATAPTDWVSRPELFDASWLTADELSAVCRCLESTPPLLHAPTRAALAAMRELDRSGMKSRFVFWFS